MREWLQRGEKRRKAIGFNDSPIKVKGATGGRGPIAFAGRTGGDWFLYGMKVF